MALREQADFAFKISDLADESETETVCKGEGTKAGWEKKERSGFIHQSLGANNASAGPGIYHEGIPHHRTNGVPKFLTSKKHETATPTFAVTPSKGSHLKLLMRSSAKINTSASSSARPTSPSPPSSRRSPASRTASPPSKTRSPPGTISFRANPTKRSSPSPATTATRIATASFT